jgi:mono/diheme cytochrome c family protein
MKDRLTNTPLTFRILIVLITVSTILLSTACTQTPPGNPSFGKRWFGLHHCNGCHGEHGFGGRAPRIDGTNLTFRKFIAKIRNSNSSIMPSFHKSTLSDQDAADIYAYLQADE